MQHIYSDPTFQMACDQFRLIADHLQIPKDLRERLMYPKRSIAVTVPVRMDDGSTQVFTGYRVQHHLTLGPTKGGLRFHPDGHAGRSGGAGDVDELEVRAHRVAYGGAKGGIACEPGKMTKPSSNISRAVTRRK